MKNYLLKVSAEDTGETGVGGSTGDSIRVGLREDYGQFDFDWPMIIREAEEELEDVDIDINSLQPFTAFSLEVSKCIYERLGYPSSRGGFEKAFIEFLNTDGEVERFLKISENMHSFAVIYYMRTDGNISS